MHWSEDELEGVLRFPIEGTAEELGSPVAFIEETTITEGNVPANIRERLQRRNFDFAPVRPFHTQLYIDVNENDIREIDQRQYVRPDAPIIQCLNVLTAFPFVIVRESDDAPVEIVTPADFNSRVAKEYLYPFFAETARSVSDLIEARYTSVDILPIYRDRRENGEAVHRWEVARERNVELHVAEFMNLTDLKEVMAELVDIRDAIGLTSKTQCRDKFEAVAGFRDRVMHANRRLVDGRSDLKALANAIDATAYLTNNCRTLLQDGHDSGAEPSYA